MCVSGSFRRIGWDWVRLKVCVDLGGLNKRYARAIVVQFIFSGVQPHAKTNFIFSCFKLAHGKFLFKFVKFFVMK